MPRIVKVVALADTHGAEPKVPDGDVLVHAGDLTTLGREDQVERAAEWLGGLPHRSKLVVAGNHDGWCERHERQARMLFASYGLTYLCDEGAEVAGFMFWGSPYTPKFGDWWFHHERGSKSAVRRWACVPDGLDVLVTHGPPFGIGDRSHGRCVGDRELLDRVTGMLRPPTAHLFGHIHEDPGTWQLDDLRTRFVNVSTDHGRRRPATFDLVAR